MATVKSLETEVALVKNDVSQIGNLFEKLEVALDKITDVNNSISQMLAVHEQRLTEGDREFKEMKQELNVAENKFDNEVKELHSRLTTNTREIETKMSDEIDKVLEAIKDLKSHMVVNQEKLDKRITALEKWRWIILGAFAAGGFLVGNDVTFSSMMKMIGG
jgi:chromosome segregation ATPase